MRKRQSSTHIRDETDSDEESAEATHPQVQESFVSFPQTTTLREDCFSIIEQLKQCRECWVQIMTIYIAAVLTYSYNNGRDHSTNVQIVIMTVLTLVGASPIVSTHLIPTAIGAFVGGQNIIGSTGLMEDNQDVSASNYLWLMLLSIIVGLVWYFIINNPRLKILDGYAGRLGSTTFLGMNLSMFIFCSVGVANWNRYYYGIIHAIHIAEEDTSTTLATDIWIWSEEIELAIGYVLSVVWLGGSAGWMRILHNNHIQRCKVDAMQCTPPAPLNNVSFPSLWALLCMLAVNATQYKHASGLFNGFAVGAYVAMASLQKISSLTQFLVVSSLAALWGLLLTPFFVGFAGSKCICLYTYSNAMDLIPHHFLFSRYKESGFTSMLGHVTYNILESIVRRVWSARLKSIQEEQQQALESSSLTREIVQEEAPSSTHQHHHKPKQEAFYTKQQRRQQKKLKHLHDEEENDTPKLHHRAWSALPVEGDSEWKYSPSLESQQELNNVV